MNSGRRFWWVNQNQTFDHEVPGGYLWSPKHSKGGIKNRYYQNMREVAPGDVIFSFAGTQIKALGIARSYAYECPKPLEFGPAGAYWDNIGWKVDVAFIETIRPFRPKEHMGILAPLLPNRYSPLQAKGDGMQSVYLAEIPQAMAEALAGLSGDAALSLLKGPALGVSEPRAEMETLTEDRRQGVEEWEDHILKEEILENDKVRPTEKISLVKARRGQGIFKDRVMRIERACRITRVDNPEHLRASHIKPWRDSRDKNEERLDGENGLLLTPTMDHLFDRGFISFENGGSLIISPRADLVSLARMGVNSEAGLNVGGFSEGQRHYLDYHRSEVLLRIAS